MQRHELFIVDVFAQEKYAGNQLAVVTNAASLSDEQMRRIARETNYSETTFIVSADDPASCGVRIFTPAGEIPFAGHPTLGTAWVLREYLLRDRPDAVTLNLELAPVTVRFAAEPGAAELAWMKTPMPSFGRLFDAPPFAELLGVEVSDIDPLLPIEEVSLGVPFTFVPLRGRAAVQRARFRLDVYERLRALDFHPCLFVFCAEPYAEAHHFNARMFAPTFGIAEDPATGSANACLGAYLLRHASGDRVDVRVEQGYEIGRPSILHVRAQRRGQEADIEVGGQVVGSARGELL